MSELYIFVLMPDHLVTLRFIGSPDTQLLPPTDRFFKSGQHFSSVIPISQVRVKFHDFSVMS